MTTDEITSILQDKAQKKRDDKRETLGQEFRILFRPSSRKNPAAVDNRELLFLFISFAS